MKLPVPSCCHGCARKAEYAHARRFGCNVVAKDRCPKGNGVCEAAPGDKTCLGKDCSACPGFRKEKVC